MTKRYEYFESSGDFDSRPPGTVRGGKGVSIGEFYVGVSELVATLSVSCTTDGLSIGFVWQGSDDGINWDDIAATSANDASVSISTGSKSIPAPQAVYAYKNARIAAVLEGSLVGSSDDTWAIAYTYNADLSYAENVAVEAVNAIACPVQSDGIIVTQWQSGHGWTSGSGGTQNYDDTSTFYAGTQCASITTGGTGVAKYLRRTGIGPYDLTGKMLKLAIRFDNQAHLSNSTFAIQFDAASDSFANIFRFGLWTTQGQKYQKEGDWCNFAIPWDSNLYEIAAGTPDRSYITDFQIRVIDDNTSEAVTAYCGQLSIISEHSSYPNGVVSITFDDGWATVPNVAAPILATNAFPATAYVISEYVGAVNRVTLADLSSLQSAGWDIAAHAYSASAHNDRYVNLTEQQVADDCDLMIAWLKANGFNGWRHMAYPGGDFDDGPTDALAVIRTKYLAARTIYQRMQETYPPSDAHKLRVCYVTNTSSLAVVQGFVDRAVASKEWLILVFHTLVSAPSVSTEWAIDDFTSLMTYIALTYPSTPVKTIADVLGI
jgi:hypothetical protein